MVKISGIGCVWVEKFLFDKQVYNSDLDMTAMQN